MAGMSYGSLPLSQDADDGLPKVVRRNPTKFVTKLCVNCLSPLVKGSELGGWLVPQDYYCGNCGYKGYVYLEDRWAENTEAKEGIRRPSAELRQP
jgi:hypothetical protein